MKKITTIFFLSEIKNKQIFVWKVTPMLPMKKWKWKIQSVSSWLECCARICRHLCFVLFLSVCVFVFILNFFLHLFFFYDTGFLDSVNLSHAFVQFASDIHAEFLTIIDLWLFLPLTWPFDLCVAGYVALPLWKSISQRFNRRDRTLCLWLGFESQKCDFLWFFFSAAVQPANWLTVRSSTNIPTFQFNIFKRFRFHFRHSSIMWKCNDSFNSPHCFSSLRKISVRNTKCGSGMKPWDPRKPQSSIFKGVSYFLFMKS